MCNFWDVAFFTRNQSCSSQSTLSIFAQKYLRKCKDTYFILQNRYLLIYKDSFGVKILLVEYCRIVYYFSISRALCHIHSSKGIYFQGPSHQQNSYKKPQHNSLIIFQIKVDYMTFHLDYTTLGSQFQGSEEQGLE